MNIEDCWYKEVCTADISCNSCIRFIEMNSLMEQSNLPSSKQRPIALYPEDCDRDAFNRLAEIKSNIVEFVNRGNNLLIASSNPGNGKTSWSIKLLLRYFDQIWAGNGLRCRGVFVSVPWFLTKQKDFNNMDNDFEALKKKILAPDTDIVIWDDIASTTMSGYDYSHLLTMIDQRILAEKTNIFTSNRTGKDLFDSVGSKLHSRIEHNSEVIILHGGDYRYGNIADFK